MCVHMRVKSAIFPEACVQVKFQLLVNTASRWVFMSKANRFTPCFCVCATFMDSGNKTDPNVMQSVTQMK